MVSIQARYTLSSIACWFCEAKPVENFTDVIVSEESSGGHLHRCWHCELLSKLDKSYSLSVWVRYVTHMSQTSSFVINSSASGWRLQVRKCPWVFVLNKRASSSNQQVVKKFSANQNGMSQMNHLLSCFNPICYATTYFPSIHFSIIRPPPRTSQCFWLS
jgi:hypothetical protein